MNVVFLILHYKALETTEKCIDSILKYSNVYIYVLDNGSNDGSGEIIQKKYKKKGNIKIFIKTENLGFSRGNNFLFEKIKDSNIPFDCLIVCNNDIVFEQKDFINILNKYLSTEAAIIGPDIKLIGSENIHQNPIMLDMISKKRLYHNICVIKRKQKYPNLFKLEVMIKKFILKIFHRKTKEVINYELEQRKVCLYGACMIFTLKYFEKYDSLFKPETFFYYEESILQYKLNRSGDFMMYLPELQVLHNHSVSTNLSYNGELEKNIFETENLINSSKVLLRYIKDNK